MSDDSFADFREADGRFAKGNRGGPGRPRARERIAALDQRVAEAGDDLIDAALKQAKAGNVKAIEVLLDRIWPARRERSMAIDAPEILTTADLVPAAAAVASAVLSGDLTPREDEAAASVINAHGNMIEVVELEPLLRKLEDEAKRRRSERE